MPTGRTAPRIRAAIPVYAVPATLGGALIGIAVTGAGAANGIVDPPTAVLVGIPVARALLAVAAVATVGLSLLPILVRDERVPVTEPVLAVARRAATVTALLWATCAMVVLVLQVAELHGTTTAIGVGDLREYATQVAGGRALVIVAALALAHVALGAVAVRAGEKVPAEARTGLALFALLPLPVTGHASTWDRHEYLSMAVELHVLGASAWAGGLAALLLLAGNRRLLATAVPRFSVLATICLLLTAVTGLASAFAAFDQQGTLGFTAALGTGYGQLVIAKVVCLAAIGLLGARLRFRLVPRIARHVPTAFASWAGLELALMGLAFGFAVVLSRTAVG
ncbi:CopD family protein [Haloechinothrix aidingensis]|uniref:copper resistance D family protein n=1 Tax=Haloechinothrix aidingensis TaxID=2752311 RepID=UPI0031B63D45